MNSKHNLNKAILAVSVGAICHQAGALTLDFEGDFIQHGTVVDTQYSGMGVSISASKYGSKDALAVAYDTEPRPVSWNNMDKDLNGEWGIGNALIVQENNWCSSDYCYVPDDEGARPAGSLYFDMHSPVNSLSFDLIDVEDNEVEDGKVVYRDSSGEVLGMTRFASLDAVWGNNSYNQSDLLDLSEFGEVSDIEFQLGGSGAIDNVNLSEAPVSTVPVPAPLAALGAGLLGLQVLRRRMKK